MAHAFILNIHTYIHTFILSYIHIYIYTYMYLNTHNVCNIGTNILTEKCNGEIFEGGSCKTMVFYSSSEIHQQSGHQGL